MKRPKREPIILPASMIRPRAILKNTPIILFDEVTSALDRNSKREVEKTINNLSKEKTVVVISHALDSIKEYDNIVLLDEGKIVKNGGKKDNEFKTTNSKLQAI